MKTRLTQDFWDTLHSNYRMQKEFYIVLKGLLKENKMFADFFVLSDLKDQMGGTTRKVQ